MIEQFLVIVNNVVENKVEGERPLIVSRFEHALLLAGEYPDVQVGFRLQNNTFVNPDAPKYPLSSFVSTPALEAKLAANNYAEVTYDIVITSVTGSIKNNTNLTRLTLIENTDVLVEGTLAVPDRDFSLVIFRDDRRKYLFPASVVDGKFSVIVNFPTVGQFEYNMEAANVDVAYNTFSTPTIFIDVQRKISDDPNVNGIKVEAA